MTEARITLPAGWLPPDMTPRDHQRAVVAVWFQWYGMMLQQEVVPGSDPTIFDALLGENDPDGPGTAESTAERRLTAAPEKTKSPEAEAPGG